jgi:hypothetical protein
MSYDYRYEACVAAPGSAMYDKLEVLIEKSHVVRTLHELSGQLRRNGSVRALQTLSLAPA